MHLNYIQIQWRIKAQVTLKRSSRILFMKYSTPGSYLRIDRFDSKNPQNINSETLVNLTHPRRMASAVVDNNINSLLQATFIDCFSDKYYDIDFNKEKEVPYYNDLKKTFGIGVARIPLSEILSDEEYSQFQYKKADFVRDLFLDENYKNCKSARAHWINSFMPMNPEDCVKALNLYSNNDLWQQRMLANKTIKTLKAGDIEELKQAYDNLNSKTKKLYLLSELWNSSHPLVAELNELVSDQDLKEFCSDLHQLCLKDSVHGFVKSFGDRLDLGTHHLKDMNYICNNYQDEGYAYSLIDVIGKSLKKKKIQLDENLYEFFTTDGVSSVFKEQLAAELAPQEQDNKYYDKLREQKISNYRISSNLMDILRSKLKPFDPIAYVKKNQARRAKTTDKKKEILSNDDLTSTISDFKLFATEVKTINAKTIQELAELAPKYLLTEFPAQFTLDKIDVNRYADDLILVLQKIDSSHYSSDSFNQIKETFLEPVLKVN